MPPGRRIKAIRQDNRIAVVTGGGAGIGRGVSIALSRAGYRVIVADIDLATAQATADQIEGQAITVDVGERAAVEALAEAAEAIGPLMLWVNSAGIGAMCPIEAITPEIYERVRRVNMDGTLWGCAAAARHMIPRGGGSIINISSNAADQPIPTLSLYAMTKAAVNMLTRSLASELGNHGIRVNGIAPGFIVTPMTVPATYSIEERAVLIERNAARSPLQRVGEPEDIAEAVIYLASDAARFVTGQTLRVNGGVAMP